MTFPGELFSFTIYKLYVHAPCAQKYLEYWSEMGKQNEAKCCLSVRVWKGILGIQDLTKIWCGIRENEKYLDEIRDLTATREAGLTKIWARDAGFCYLSVGNLWNRHDLPQKNVIAANANQPGERKMSIERANLHLKSLLAFAEISLF